MSWHKLPMTTGDCRVLNAKQQFRGDDTVVVSVVSHAFID